jgi:hypothetical protein
MNPEDRVPGITFHHVSSALSGTHSPGTRTIRVTLDATVTDEELWEETKKKFIEGLRVYKGEDFHFAIIDAIKADHDDLRREHEALQRELRQEKDARALVEAELTRYKEPLTRLGSALRGT